MRRGGIRAVGAALACSLGVASAVSGSLAPSPQIIDSARIASVAMTAAVAPGQTGVEVRLEYRLDGDPGTLEGPVRIHALGIGDTEVGDLRLLVPGSSIEPRALTLTGGQGVVRSAVVDLAEMGGDVLVLSYRVSGALDLQDGAVRARLPLLILDLPQAGTTRSTFRAAISVPEWWRVAGTFPSGLRAATPGVWSGDLQVVPAFVSISARTDARWRPGLPWALDVATVLILVGVSFVGWRHLSGVVREARA